jgi:CheY-like chemotaxis protein
MKLREATILVVDDEPALREIFAKWLTAIGCGHVSTAANGEDALRQLTGGQFDLLITDVRMPVMDGVTLVRRLAAEGVSIPSIVFVSGFGDVDKKEMYALGVEAFLSKPLRMEDIVQAAETALAARSELWRKPMENVPRQRIAVEADRVNGKAESRKMGLGRGGFSAHYAGHVSLGKVAFRCLVESMDAEMAGEGYIRWRSKEDETLGIEFVYLDEACRGWVLRTIEEMRSRSFIPE